MTGELESLDTAEPLETRRERHGFDRLIMLSDGVFAIAVTLLALELRPPEVWNGNLWDLLVATWRSLFAYLLGFMVVSAFWFSNRRLFVMIRRVDGAATVLTLLLLCLVAMSPAVAELIARHGPIKATKVQALLVALIGLVQASLWIYAAFWGRLVDSSVTDSERRLVLAQLLILPTMFALLFAGSALGLASWAPLPVLVGALLLGIAKRIAQRRIGRPI